MTDCTCLACGGTFNHVPSAIAVGKGKFCSNECRDGLRGFRRQVCDALPGTILDIQKRTGLSHPIVSRHVAWLQANGHAQASRMVSIPSTGKRGGCLMVILYEAGAGDDPDMPAAPRQARMYMLRKSVLDAMPGTQVELRERIGSNSASMPRLIAELHAAGRCHITSWRKGGANVPTPVYTAGQGTDRACNLRPLTKSQVNRRYKKRLEKRGMLEEYRARDAAQQRTARMVKRGDPLINALFGKGRAANKESI